MKLLKIEPESQPMQFETLHIELIYLLRHKTRPENEKHLPNIELRVKVTESDNKYCMTFYCYNDEYLNSKEKGYPRAFGKYFFHFEVNENDIYLGIEKSDFEKVFFLELGQEAVIENKSEQLQIETKNTSSEWSEDIDGNYTESREFFEILMSDGNEEGKLNFGALYEADCDRKWLSDRNDIKEELVFEWKEYQFFILDAGEILKLKVSKSE